jgi:site-specific recombinase XerD
MAVDGAFRLELFADYLTFERGLSDRSVKAYFGDVERMAEWLTARGHTDPSLSGTRISGSTSST